jgi:hypothetical protein
LQVSFLAEISCQVKEIPFYSWFTKVIPSTMAPAAWSPTVTEFYGMIFQPILRQLCFSFLYKYGELHWAALLSWDSLHTASVGVEGGP